MEAFHKDQINFTSGGPKVEAMLYDKKMLAEDFAYCKNLEITKEHIYLEEGKHHLGEAAVLRMIATI